MSVLLLQGDARRIPLADRSVHCVVTSPPYWGLRDYGTARWYGGDPACDHRESKPSRVAASAASSTLGGGKGNVHRSHEFKGHCLRCGAHRVDRQIGLEETPDEFVASMVRVFREVRRVLRDDGTLWLNLGDSYNAHPGQRKSTDACGPKQRSNVGANTIGSRSVETLKPKDLVGIPWRVALALQADGWFLRADIIWSKPNPMPESVADRPTKAHEYLFLLAKSERYFYDAEAIKEPMAEASEGRYAYAFGGSKSEQLAEANRDGIGVRTRPIGFRELASGRNKRSVWTITVGGFPGAHFATFPRALVDPCIRAGTSEVGCCPACGAGWIRTTEKHRVPTRSGQSSKVYVDPEGSPYERHSGSVVGNRDPFRHCTATRTTGWRSACSCDAGDPVPCVVFDPFNGAATTGVVARSLGRCYIGTDLNREYLDMSRDRIADSLRPVSRLDAAPTHAPLAGQATLFGD